MKVYDKDLKVEVNVYKQECLKYACYWPRTDPGVFTQGQGYKQRGRAVVEDWLCGTRQIHGCPKNPTEMGSNVECRSNDDLAGDIEAQQRSDRA